MSERQNADLWTAIEDYVVASGGKPCNDFRSTDRGIRLLETVKGIYREDGKSYDELLLEGIDRYNEMCGGAPRRIFMENIRIETLRHAEIVADNHLRGLDPKGNRYERRTSQCGGYRKESPSDLLRRLYPPNRGHYVCGCDDE